MENDRFPHCCKNCPVQAELDQHIDVCERLEQAEMKLESLKAENQNLKKQLFGKGGIVNEC